MSEAKPKPLKSLVRRPLLAAALVASVVTPAPAMASFDIFLKLDNVNGESTAKGHDKWIQLFSYATAFQQRTSGGGASPGIAVGKATCSPVGAVKLFDASSPPLLNALMTGQVFQKGEIDLVKTGTDGGPGSVFLKYEFQNVLISSLQDSGAAGGDSAPEESLSMTFGRMVVTYSQQSNTGAASSSISAAANCGLPAVQ